MTPTHATLMLTTALTAALALADGMLTYTQTVELAYASAEAAGQATLTALPLPPGKRVAFSSRWDDTNPDHAKMVKTLGSRGCSGTFFLNRVDARYADTVIRDMLANGFSVGSHTDKHPNLTTLKPNAIFKAITANRITLEAASQSCVNSFTLPYCAYTKKDDPDMPRLIGDCLIRSGMLGSPEYWPDVASRYSVAPQDWVGGYTFSIDDRNPNAERFNGAIAKGLASLDGKGLECGPHLVLGIHTWQKTDENFARLGEIVSAVTNRADWWYCNENQYIAYRMQMFHSRIVRASASGKTARFTVERVTPSELGDAVALGLQAAGSPIAVRVDGGKAFTPGADGTFALPHSVQHSLTRHFGVVENAGNGLAMLDATAFPGLRGVLSYDAAKNTVRATLSNTTSNPLRDIHWTFRLPPKWKTGVVRRAFGDLKPGETRDVVLSLGENRSDEDYQTDFFFVAQCDFSDEAGPSRLYLTAEAGPVTEAPPKPAK